MPRSAPRAKLAVISCRTAGLQVRLMLFGARASRPAHDHDADLEVRAPARGLSAAFLETGQELREIAAEVVAEIAAFLDQHRRQAEARDLLRHRVKTGARHLQALQRIAFA